MGSDTPNESTGQFRHWNNTASTYIPLLISLPWMGLPTTPSPVDLVSFMGIYRMAVIFVQQLGLFFWQVS